MMVKNSKLNQLLEKIQTRAMKARAYDPFIEQMKEVWIQSGLSQEKFAERIGIAQSTLSTIFGGSRGLGIRRRREVSEKMKKEFGWKPPLDGRLLTLIAEAEQSADGREALEIIKDALATLLKKNK